MFLPNRAASRFLFTVYRFQAIFSSKTIIRKPGLTLISVLVLIVLAALVAIDQPGSEDQNEKGGTGSVSDTGAPSISTTSPVAEHSKPLRSSDAGFVGSDQCQQCHQSQFELWQQSHHHHAMAAANSSTVLGHFEGEAKYFETITRFSEQQGRYVMTTENSKGEQQGFPVDYTLGIEPLQQYLTTLPDGRIQVLPFAWDTRQEKDGGQRWFHLYPDRYVGPGDPLFWMGPMQNWNHMCADCHTTSFEKHFDPSANTFNSQWKEPGAGCESCHGPGKAHIEKISAGKKTGLSDWAVPQENLSMEQCANCHSRRHRLQENVNVQKPGQTWQPEWLHAPLYHDDGQINDEVFVMGSFMQSKMFRAGVTCVQCHDPHKGEVRKQGNSLCASCHVPEQYDTPQHHLHRQEPLLCVNCHMPGKTYMQVDFRRDHRFSVPRPDLSETIGVPNACNQCHTEKDASWAAQKVREHFGEQRPKHFAGAFHNARTWQVDAGKQLLDIINNESEAVLVRASAIALMAPYVTHGRLQQLLAFLEHASPLLRTASVRLVAELPAASRQALLRQSLHDETLSVRLAATEGLAADVSGMDPEMRHEWKQAAREFIKVMELDLDRATSRLRLANFYLVQGNVLQAQKNFEASLALDPTSLPARLNYADFFRAQGNEPMARQQLERALAIWPESPDVYHALALSHVRQKDTRQALLLLDKARNLDVGNPGLAYVHAVALYSTGKAEQAVVILEAASQAFPAYRQIQEALVSYYRELKQPEKALNVARGLRKLDPDNENYLYLVRELENY
jgi:predicted CXXCH cytochrome family protein